MAHPVFDDDARALIRARLLAYAEEQGFNPQRFCNKMKEVTGYEYARSTLLRFLDDIGNTNDAAVKQYKEFLDTLPAPETVSALGTDLAAFYGRRPPNPYSHEPDEDTALFAAGTYHTNVEAAEPGRAAGLVSYSQFTLSPLPGTKALQIEEAVHNPERSVPALPNEPAPADRYEGLVLFFGAAGLALQRHAGTRLPRTVHIKSAPPYPSERPPVFELSVTEIPFRALSEDNTAPLSSFTARLAAGEGQDY